MMYFIPHCSSRVRENRISDNFYKDSIEKNHALYFLYVLKLKISLGKNTYIQ